VSRCFNDRLRSSSWLSLERINGTAGFSPTALEPMFVFFAMFLPCATVWARRRVDVTYAGLGGALDLDALLVRAGE
jgi:hypothetical protein